MTLAAPTATQQDALAEIANIGSGHAASMLARLINGLGVMVDVPRVSLVDSTQLVTLLSGSVRDVRRLPASYTNVVIGEVSEPVPSGSGKVTCVIRFSLSNVHVVTLPSGFVSVTRRPFAL